MRFGIERLQSMLGMESKISVENFAKTILQTASELDTIIKTLDPKLQETICDKIKPNWQAKNFLPVAGHVGDLFPNYQATINPEFRIVELILDFKKKIDTISKKINKTVDGPANKITGAWENLNLHEPFEQLPLKDIPGFLIRFADKLGVYK